MKKLLILAFATFAFGITSFAKAEDKAAPEGEAAKAAAPSGAHADVKAATGIENRLPTGEATSFKAGTLIYVWSQVTGANGKEVQHVWKRDGQEFRRAKFSIGSVRWSMNSRMPGAKKGNYVVEVMLGDEKLGETTFVVE
jgi:hypothetical protein